MGAEAVQGIPRGCGMRKSGGLYLESGTTSSRTARPLEAFLCDPPVPMTTDCKVGVELIERGGVVHILDWVGAENYPNAADFLEEGRVLGFSRLISKNLDLSRLTADSRILIVHARGLVTNHEELRPHMPESYNDAYRDGRRKPAFEHHCGHLEKTAIPGHFTPHPHKHACTRDLWALPPASRAEDGSPPRYLRDFASVSYEVFPLSPDAPATETTPALVASLPITNIAVVKAEGGAHRKTVERVKEMLTWEGGLRISVTEADA